MIRVLRPAARASLISAQVFDDAFASCLAPDVDVRTVELSAWLDAILGDDTTCASATVQRAFREATRGFDFLCPNYLGMAVLPLLLWVRNESAAAIRLALVAHAPGAYALEWALLEPLLRRGDRIIAPSESARDVVGFMSPRLAAHVRVVPHPIRPLPHRRHPEPSSLVSLTRLHPTKLLHRQIEAMGILRRRGRAALRLRIAGSPTEGAYARALETRIERLQLHGHVELLGPIHGASAKAELFSTARLCLNLSATVEESFGKSVGEALGCGVPALVTRWDGLPEVAGHGPLVELLETESGFDVCAERLADQIEAALAPALDRAVYRRRALRFHPRRVRSLYRRELEHALDAHVGAAADAREALVEGARTGLLDHTAPLNQMSWGELFQTHLEDVSRFRLALRGLPVAGRSEADELRDLLLQGTRLPVSRLLAGRAPEASCTVRGESRRRDVAGSGLSAIVVAAASRRATEDSRLACLDWLAQRAGSDDALDAALTDAASDGIAPDALAPLAAELRARRGDYEAAFRLLTRHTSGGLFWPESAAQRLHGLAALCRCWHEPQLALPWLRDWLGRFPDGPVSASIWLDLCANALQSGPELAVEARRALEWVRRLSVRDADLSALEAALGSLEALPSEAGSPIDGAPPVPCQGAA